MLRFLRKLFGKTGLDLALLESDRYLLKLGAAIDYHLAEAGASVSKHAAALAEAARHKADEQKHTADADRAARIHDKLKELLS